MSAPLIIRHSDGSTEGRDPREIQRQELEAAGHRRRPLLKAIRAKCLDCCAGQPGEIKRCTAIGCALWPYRMATDPFARGRGQGKPFQKFSRQIGANSTGAGPPTDDGGSTNTSAEAGS